MSNISDLAMDVSEPTLEDMLQEETRRVALEMDPFHAARHNERMDVAARDVRTFLNDHRRPKDRARKRIGLFEVINLDPGAVADVVAWDLGPAGKERVADMVQHLTDHARKYLAERQALVQEIPPSLANGLADFIQRILAQHISYPIRSRITLDLAIHPAASNPSR